MEIQALEIAEIKRIIDMCGGGVPGRDVLADKMRERGAKFKDNGSIDNWVMGRNGWYPRNRAAFHRVRRQDFPLVTAPIPDESEPAEDLPEMDLPEIVEVPDFDDTIPHKDIPRLLGLKTEMPTDLADSFTHIMEKRLATFWLQNCEFMDPIIENQKMKGVRLK